MIATLILLCPQAILSDVPDNQKHEVAHLLAFVKESACSIERNGKRYTGDEAQDHILKKYDYFRDKIRSTEDFIAYAATKSTMSGKNYLARCDGAPPVPTKDWLLAELNSYRNRSGN